MALVPAGTLWEASPNESARRPARARASDAPGRRPQPRLLLAAAREVFGRDGLDSGVEAVARQAGVGTGTLYRHFPSKDDLIAALVDDLSQEVLENAQACLARRERDRNLGDFLQSTGAIQAEKPGPALQALVGGWSATRATGLPSGPPSLNSSMTRTSTGRYPLGIEQPDIILILHGLRGVIEANAGGPQTDLHPWLRYLELATQSLRPA